MRNTTNYPENNYIKDTNIEITPEMENITKMFVNSFKEKMMDILFTESVEKWYWKERYLEEYEIIQKQWERAFNHNMCIIVDKKEELEIIQ